MNSNFFTPACVVVIGASSTEGKVGNDLIKNLNGFAGEVFGVNPKAGGYKKATFFTSISELPQTPDLAIIAIPAKFVAKSLEECGQRGIKNIVIISAGFKEMGNMEGEQEIIKIGKKYSLNILGPNCLGFLNPHSTLNASFAEKLPKAGNIALISQSGAMAVALMDWAKSSGVGFSKIISMGNKSDLDECDFLEYLAQDEKTKVIVLYLESIKNGRKFYELAKKITPHKPIIMVKSGISERGSQAASSHTGALTGKKEVLQTAMKQAGIHSTGFLEDLFSWSQIFSEIDSINLHDDLAIITNAGGPGVMATDNTEKFGVQLAEFSNEEKKILMKDMPSAASVTNPLDILGDGNSKRYEQMLKNISKFKTKRNILVMLTHQTTTDVENVAQKIIEFQKQNPDQVIMASFMGGKSVEAGRKILEEAGILHFNYPKEAIKAFGELGKQRLIKCSGNNLSSPVSDKHDKSVPLPEKKQIESLHKKLATHSGLLPPQIVTELFSAFNIPFAEEKLATTADKAVQIWKETQTPKQEGKENSEIVMKIISPDIAHKTDCGGVRLNISGIEEVRQTFEEIISSSTKAYPNANIIGVSLQKMFPKSREVFIGAKRDKSFGEILLVGFGGVYVNIFEDISRRIAPVNKQEIGQMIREIKAYKLLQGVRGEKPIDFEALENTIYKLQNLFMEFTEITDIDLNPIFVREDGAWVIDGKFFI